MAVTQADPLAKGTFATAKQSLRDLTVWRQRVVVTTPEGETHTEWRDPDPIQNPITLLAQLSARDWLFFVVGFLAWTADAFDFHALSIQTKKLATYYDRSKTDITTAITLTLLLRSVGAAAFGLAGDAWGRKWPMVANMIILGLLQIATIYSTTFQQFLAVRSLFGLFMGGVYGNAIAMALEHCPTNARGLMSGILQQGYSFGYVLAACANLGVGGETNTWKTVFWIAAKASGAKSHTSAGDFWRATRAMIRAEWRMCIYCIILMTWFNYYSHTSQDSYTTFMLTQKQLDNAAASRASILMKTGACLGNAISSPSAQIVNAIAENTLITIQGKKGPTKVEAFGPTMGIATAIIAMGIVCTTMLGPEKRGRSFENAVAGVQTDDHLEQKVADIEKDEEAGVESKEESRVETAR
ncbi:hypothetical protein VdG1_09502 [Verticillium dahliae VDG1]|nr:hypothetical protein VdG1_09502 [Verticillium dahliae VDG1]